MSRSTFRLIGVPKAHRGDLPSDALPLAQAFYRHADSILFSHPHSFRKCDLRNDLTRHYYPGGFVLHGFVKVEGKDRLNRDIENSFIDALRRGVLQAWGREGSRCAPMTQIPASAWDHLWPDALWTGSVRDAHFPKDFCDVWVCHSEPARPDSKKQHPQSKGEGKPGAPKKIEDGMALAHWRSEQGKTLVSLEAEATEIVHLQRANFAASTLANALRRDFPRLLVQAEYIRRKGKVNATGLALWYNDTRKRAPRLTPLEITPWLIP